MSSEKTAYFRTQYEKLYSDEDYYWGLEPAPFLDELIAWTGKNSNGLKVLDVGCGEGKDAVYMAQKGCEVTAFDITKSGIRKTKKLAKTKGVKINAFVADINDFQIDDEFDVITISLQRQNRRFFCKDQAIDTDWRGCLFQCVCEQIILRITARLG
jgi:2-polyprenyl-3-methyl-5-hydroxy-6-metoxy-1,4-benzoquinol methylase